jgi:hypothetical protein
MLRFKAPLVHGIPLLCAFVLSSCSSLGFLGQSTSMTPQEVVSSYCKEDAAGAQTAADSEEDSWLRKIKPLSTWEDAPGWDTFQVIQGFQVLEPTEDPADKAQVQVEYQVLGKLNSDEEGYSFQLAKQTKKVTYDLIRTGKTWKIEAPQLEPHISVETAEKMLEKNQVNGEIISAKTKDRHQEIINKLKKETNHLGSN